MHDFFFFFLITRKDSIIFILLLLYMYTKAYKSNIYCLIYLKLIDLYTFYDFKKIIIIF